MYRNKAALDVTTTKGTADKPAMKSTLDENGYPVITMKDIKTTGTEVAEGKGSLQYLFDVDKDYDNGNQSNSAETYDPTASGGNNYVSKHFAVKNENGEGTGLFWRDENGYLVFDSALHRAAYNQETQKFDLYDYALRPYWGSANLRGQGHFLPFNYDLSSATRIIKDGVITDNQAALDAAHLDTIHNGHPDDETKHVNNLTVMQAYAEKNPLLATIADDLWVLPDTATDKTGTYTSANGTEYRYWQVPDENRKYTADYYYGMSIEFDFFMPEGGLVEDEPMVFDFLGDDDVWVYIDDVLVLNIGGGHNPMIGYVDFSTGMTKQPAENDTTSSTKLVKSTLYDIYKKSGKYTEAELLEIFNGNTFKDNTKHTLKFFYMERGSGSANCKLKFNIPTLPANSLSITKEVEDSGNYANGTQYGFQVWKTDSSGKKSELAVKDGDTYSVYVGTSETVSENRTVAEDNTIYLAAGERAVISNMMDKTYDSDEDYGYRVEEVDPGKGYTTEYSINGGDPVPDLTTKELSAEVSQSVVFTNSVKPGDLSITKTVLRTDGGEPSGSFDFQVKHNGSVLENTPYEIYTYTKQLVGEGGAQTEEWNWVKTSDSVVTNGVITLAHNQKAVITGLAAVKDGGVEVTELTTDGYAVKWTKGDTDYLQTSITAGIDPGAETKLTCTNTTGAMLPSTGGIGTNLFTTLGTVMMLGAGVLLLDQRRRKGGPSAT